MISSYQRALLALTTAALSAAACDDSAPPQRAADELDATSEERQRANDGEFQFTGDLGAQARPGLLWEVSAEPEHAIVRKDDVVLVYLSDGRFELRHNTTGDILSQGSLPEDFALPGRYRGARPATGLQRGDRRIAADGELLFVADDRTLTAVALADGAVAWQEDIAATRPFATRAASESPIPVELRVTPLSDGVAASITHYDDTQSCSIIVFDAAGERRWTRELEQLCGVLGEHNGELLTFAGEAKRADVTVVGHRPADGEQLRSFVVEDFDRLTVTGSKLVASGLRRFAVYDLAGGERIAESNDDFKGLVGSGKLFFDSYERGAIGVQTVEGETVRTWPWRDLLYVVADDERVYTKASGQPTGMVVLDVATGSHEVLDLGSAARGSGRPDRWFSGNWMLDLTARRAPQRGELSLEDEILQLLDEDDFSARSRLETIPAAERQPTVDRLVAKASFDQLQSLHRFASRDAVRTRVQELLEAGELKPSDVGVVAAIVRDDATDGATRLIEKTLGATRDQPTSKDWTLARLQLIGSPTDARPPRRYSESALVELVNETAKRVRDIERDEILPTRLHVFAHRVVNVATLGTDAPNIAAPLLKAIREKGPAPICRRPFRTVPDYDSCGFEEPPADHVASESGNVVVFPSADHRRGELLVMRRLEDRWKPAAPLGVQVWAPASLMQNRAWSDDVTVRETGDGLAITYRPDIGDRRSAPDVESLELSWSEIEADSDADGWSDLWERAVGTDPARPDSDNDGKNDPIDSAPLCAWPPEDPDEFAAVEIVLADGHFDGIATLTGRCLDYPLLGARVVSTKGFGEIEVKLEPVEEPPEVSWTRRLEMWWDGEDPEIPGPSYHDEWSTAPLRYGQGTRPFVMRQVNGQWRVFAKTP